jgi:Ca2+-transporting ATPase
MGDRGSDVAREAASLILLQGGFGAIVATIRLGRRIFDNLQRAVSFVVAVHLPIAGLAVLPLFAGADLVLAPLHIAFLEMFIDPVCSIAFEAEPEEPDIMRRPPRRAGERLITRSRLLISLTQGAIGLAVVLGAYLLAAAAGQTAGQVRTIAFIILVFVDVGLVLSSRAVVAGSVLGSFKRTNPLLWLLIAAVFLVLSGVIAVPALRDLFQFALPGASISGY